MLTDLTPGPFQIFNLTVEEKFIQSSKITTALFQFLPKNQLGQNGSLAIVMPREFILTNRKCNILNSNL